MILMSCYSKKNFLSNGRKINDVLSKLLLKYVFLSAVAFCLGQHLKEFDNSNYVDLSCNNFFFCIIITDCNVIKKPGYFSLQWYFTCNDDGIRECAMQLNMKTRSKGKLEEEEQQQQQQRSVAAGLQCTCIHSKTNFYTNNFNRYIG